MDIGEIIFHKPTGKHLIVIAVATNSFGAKSVIFTNSWKTLDRYKDEMDDMARQIMLLNLPEVPIEECKRLKDMTAMEKALYGKLV